MSWSWTLYRYLAIQFLITVTVVYAIFLAGLIAPTFIDFEHFIIPDEITIGGIVVGFLGSMLVPLLHDQASVRPTDLHRIGRRERRHAR